MSTRIHHTPRPILPLDQRAKTPPKDIRTPAGEDFKAILGRLQGEIKFSHHALERLQKRNISLTNTNISRLQNAMDRAADKGAKESLVLMDELAFVVSIKNKTVITAMDEESMKEHVFTNIDSAVVIK